MNPYALHCQHCRHTHKVGVEFCEWCGEKMPVFDFETNCQTAEKEIEILKAIAQNACLKITGLEIQRDALRSALRALYFDTTSNYHNEQTINTVKMLLGLQEQPKTL